MKYFGICLLVVFGILVFLFDLPLRIYSYTTGMSATYVIGQPDFVTSSAGVTTTKLTYPTGMTAIGSKFAISHAHRVLIYNSIPASSNVSADVVIGQSNFTSNTNPIPPSATTYNNNIGITTDGTKLLVADAQNNRILIYNAVPTSNGASANVVIGQTNMTNNNTGLTSTTLNYPTDVHYSATLDKLAVLDRDGSRVMIYHGIPTTNGVAANVVVGANDFNTANIDTTASTFDTPEAVKIFNNKLFVADKVNDRVLIWNTVPTLNGAAADVVVGQSNFTSGLANQGGTVGANTLKDPSDIFYDGTSLFISDTGNHRVLVYSSIPTTNNASATLVIGQPNFTSNQNGQGLATSQAYTLSEPSRVFGIGGSLFVSDSNHNRVLKFLDDAATPTPVATTTTTTTTSTQSTTNSESCSVTEAPGSTPSIGKVIYDGSSAVLTLNPASSNSTYYSLSYGNTSLASEYLAVINRAGGGIAFTYSINGLDLNKNYYFKIQASNCMYSSVWSPTVLSLRNSNGVGLNTISSLEQQFNSEIATGPASPSVYELKPSEGDSKDKLEDISLTKVDEANAQNNNSGATGYVFSSILSSATEIVLNARSNPEVVSGAENSSKVVYASIVLGSAISAAPAVSTVNSIFTNSASLNIPPFQAFGHGMNSIGSVLLGLLGIKKLRRPSLGIVFDSITNNPIGNAMVVLYSKKGNLYSTLSNKEGRFSFSNIYPGSYNLKVAQNGYIFPSKIIAVSQNQNYQTIYNSDQVLKLQGEPIANIAVPMDSVTIYRSAIRRKLSSTGQYLSYIFTTYYFYFAIPIMLLSIFIAIIIPSLLNILSMVFVLVSVILSTARLQNSNKSYGIVYDFDKNVLKKCLVQLCTLKEDVYTCMYTDMKGRYIFTPDNGEYLLCVRDQTNHLLAQKKISVNDNNPIVNDIIKIE